MSSIKEIGFYDNEFRIAFRLGIPFLILFLFLAIQTGPAIAYVVFIGVGLVIAILIEPILALVICFFVLFSGIIWGLGIANGFLPLAILSIAAWLTNKLILLDFEFIWDRQITYLVIFIAFVFLSVPGAYDQLYAFKYTLVYIKLIVFYFFVVNVIKSKKHIWMLMFMMLFANIISIVYGFYKLFWALNSPGGMDLEMRMRGLTDSPNTLALHAILIFPIFVFFIFREGWKLKSLLYLGIAFILLSGIVATFSRGGTIAFAVVTMTLLYIKRSWRLFLTILVLVLLLFLFVIPPEFFQHLTTLVDMDKFLKDSSLRERSRLLAGGIQVFLENPLFGIGIGNFLIISRKFVLEHLAVHNIIIQVASEVGLPGCIFFMAAFFRTFTNFQYARKKFEQADEKDLALVIHGLLIGFIGIFVGAMFLSMQEYFVIWTIFGFSVASRHIADKEFDNLRQNGKPIE